MELPNSKIFTFDTGNQYNPAIAEIVRYSVGKQSYLITRIDVPVMYRQMGLGSRLLRQILAWADETQSALWLEIEPRGDDGLNFNELKTWYEKYGFQQFGTTTYRRRANKDYPKYDEKEQKT